MLWSGVYEGSYAVVVQVCIIMLWSGVYEGSYAVVVQVYV